jgi:hypothetical protein
MIISNLSFISEVNAVEKTSVLVGGQTCEQCGPGSNQPPQNIFVKQLRQLRRENSGRELGKAIKDLLGRN